LFAADDVPAWVRAAASRPTPTAPGRAPAIVLFQEEILNVDAAGRRVIHERAVVRKLTAGRAPVAAVRAFNVKSGRIRDIRAWTINPDGREVRYGKDRVVESALDSGAAYEEARMKRIVPGEEWQPGGVFAYEIVEEEQTVFTQYSHAFQYQLPALVSRFELRLPPGWEARGQVFNSASDGYSSSGATHAWELRDLPWQEPEPSRTPWHQLAPRLALTYFPSGGESGLHPMKDWRAVSGWLSALADRQAEVTPEIRAKAAQLTAGTATPLAQIAAIGAFVQQTHYISVQMNITRGGGYTPHRAADVLAKNYGDCKDKANLMKALLAAAGIESHLVAIYSGAREFVRPEWPSTLQFNHMIIAVRVPEESKLAAVLDHATLGRLLFFDPTDPYTALGDLPDEEQGSHALVIAGDRGALVTVPRAPATANRAVSRTNAVIAADGTLNASVTREYFGQTARDYRSMLARRDEAGVRRSFEFVLTRQIGGVSLDKLETKDDAGAGRLAIDLRFTAPQFGRILQDRLLLVTPGALLSGGSYSFPAGERRHPVKLDAERREDVIALQVPAGFQVDELPEPVVVETGLGTFRAQWKAGEGTVEMEQQLELKDSQTPAASYGEVRAFFEQVSAAANAAVVLVRKQ
jgi:hypothetical protein